MLPLRLAMCMGREPSASPMGLEVIIVMRNIGIVYSDTNLLVFGTNLLRKVGRPSALVL